MDWEERVDADFWAAVEARQKGAPEEALALERRAEALLREHLTPELHGKLAGLLYGMAGTLLELGRADRAVGVLDEAERLYEGADGQDADRRAQLADVRVRRARAYGEVGRGLPALVDVDRAITEYARIGAMEAAGGPHALDVARVLALAAEVVLRYGDPQAALDGASQALARYGDAGRTTGIRPEDLFYALGAAFVSARVEAAAGEWDNAVMVDRWALSVVASQPQVRPAVLARLDVHLRAAGRAEEAASLRALTTLDPAAVAVEERLLAEGVPVTLRQALDEAAALDPTALAVAAGLRRDLLRMAPSTTGRAASVEHVRQLAALAAGMPGANPAAMRLALESYCILESLERNGRAEPPASLWSDVLRGALRVADAHGDSVLADDLRAAARDRGITLDPLPAAPAEPAPASAGPAPDPTAAPDPVQVPEVRSGARGLLGRFRRRTGS
ncbi:hypothetical protein GXW82_12630 [Streptacidiphilus sp. 4-A2]|nr:hypothetical protein [Streptacidiphilus sp. 4-A2]